MNVTPVSRIKRVAKSKWSWSTAALVVILGYAAIRISAAITSLEYSLTPPELPHYQEAETVLVNPWGWKEDSGWFHHASQGTATLPIPYEWLLALEAPKSNPWLSFIGREDLFVEEYLLRLGFIKGQQSDHNPDALPIGIAKTPSIYFPGINRKADAVGFTCAACHTGQLLLNDKRYVIDGGPATTDLGLLTKSLGAALGQTALSSKFSILDGRFERFAEKVLGSNNNVLTRNNLKKELVATIEYLVKTVDTINVTEGFTRLDALNRIGNQVFSADMDRPANYSPIDAPVNYPHIWTTSWFNWVQYDASIMQPLVRNAGEALGVEAYVDTTGPDAQRFASSINYLNLKRIEDWLAGTNPKSRQSFNGLQSPQWPDDFPAIDESLANQGKDLYRQLCSHCHLPTIDTPEFWSDTHWKPITYYVNGEKFETKEPYLYVTIKKQNDIGTDPAQANVLRQRSVDTTGLNLDTDVCTPLPIIEHNAPLQFTKLQDSATANYGLALGAFVQRANNQWFKQSFIDDEEIIDEIEGGRPNCLQVAKGYKARPLNGVWATAPFLHNGSVATVYDLLSSPEQRPAIIELGNQVFDPQHLGFVQSDTVKKINERYSDKSYKETPDYRDGLFLLDTREPGNHNTGHVFSDEKEVKGRVGRVLSEEERMAVIEYLKTL